MISWEMIMPLIMGFAPTLGFCLLFHVPANHIVPAALIGGLGWAAYELWTSTGSNKVIGCFLAACLVGLLSDICARTLKETSTVFSIPGIMPLVPGAGMFYTMMELIKSDFSQAAAQGSETLFMAGAIALGLMVVGSVIRIIISIKRKIYST